MMKKITVVLIAIAFLGCTGTPEPEKYEATWESLSKHEAAPEWFRDAKFGIYFHWGVYSVPAYGDEWYPRWMHFEGNHVYKHHLAHYGHPSEFGYHDFVPLFKAEHFDADEWADLFHRAGARFAGPVAEHHDGFSMWDSDVTPWNAGDMGPKRDVAGELASAIRGRGMKFITTFHHARNLQRYRETAQEELDSDRAQWEKFSNSHYPYIAGMPPSSDDPKLKYLYGNIPEAQWLEEVWYGKLKEVVDKYRPDIIWFDSWLDLIPEAYRQKFSAYYLNEAEKWGKEVVIVRKQNDLPLTYTVDDLEKSRKNRLEEEPWMTDETVSKGSWCYTEDLVIKEPRDVLHVLIDIVSKNGVLLLNISPMSDGTIPVDQVSLLLHMGNWLGRFGEAIYETRPWYTYGEGPVKEPEGHFSNAGDFLNLSYSWKDIRYTTRGKNVYAAMLGWPGAGVEIHLKSFAADSLPRPLKVRNVRLLGSEQVLNWEQSKDGLSIVTPFNAPDMEAVVFKIEGM
jgi:alpha-L-fucosidase